MHTLRVLETLPGHVQHSWKTSHNSHNTASRVQPEGTLAPSPCPDSSTTQHDWLQASQAPEAPPPLHGQTLEATLGLWCRSRPPLLGQGQQAGPLRLLMGLGHLGHASLEGGGDVVLTVVRPAVDIMYKPRRRHAHAQVHAAWGTSGQGVGRSGFQGWRITSQTSGFTTRSFRVFFYCTGGGAGGSVRDAGFQCSCMAGERRLMGLTILSGGGSVGPICTSHAQHTHARVPRPTHLTTSLTSFTPRVDTSCSMGMRSNRVVSLGEGRRGGGETG